MLKHFRGGCGGGLWAQPPSGGCVLKHVFLAFDLDFPVPAAFRRLCVETAQYARFPCLGLPAAFRRLCVETNVAVAMSVILDTSRLQAAVC